VFVHDPEATLDDCLNPEMVRVSGSLSPTDEVWLKEAVQRHWESTGSALARRLLEDWRVTLRAMRRVTPIGLPAAEPVPWPIDLGGQVPPPQPLVKVA